MAASKIIPAGFVINWRGQRYKLIGRRSHVAKGGIFTSLLIWQAVCTECGDQFTYEISVGREFGPPLRRCPICRQGKRGRRVNFHGGLSQKEWIANASRAIEMTRKVKW